MPIDFICPTCGKRMQRDLDVIVPHTEGHVIDAIKKLHPDWAKEDGTCVKCYEYYRKQLHPGPDKDKK